MIPYSLFFELISVSVKQILITVLAPLVIIAAITLITHISMWFLWEMIPSGDIKIAVNNYLLPQNKLYETLDYQPVQKIKTSLKNTRRFALSTGKDNFILAVVPKNPFNISEQKQLRENLNRENLNTKRFGLLIFAAHNEQLPSYSIKLTSKKFFNSWQKQIRYLFAPRPLLVGRFQPSTIPFIDRPLSIISEISHYARGQKTCLISYLAEELKHTKSASRLTVPSKEAEENVDFKLSLPGKTFNHLPPGLISTWNNQIQQKLSFLNTTPDIVGEISAYQHIEISSTKEVFTITTKDNNNNFSEYLENIVRQEESYSRPQRKTFKLPDGTLGYEKIPGPTRAVFNPARSQETLCKHASWPRPTEGQNKENNDYINIWMCEKNNLVSVSNKELITVRNTAETSGKNNDLWQIKIGPQHLKKIIPDVIDTINIPPGKTAINIIGQDEKAKIILNY